MRINIHLPEDIIAAIDKRRDQVTSRSRWISNLIAQHLGLINTTRRPGRMRREDEPNPYERIQPMLDRMAQVLTLDEAYAAAWWARDSALIQAAEALGYDLPTELMYEGALQEHFAAWPQHHPAEPGA